jgi:hypothetical protein
MNSKIAGHIVEYPVSARTISMVGLSYRTTGEQGFMGRSACQEQEGKGMSSDDPSLPLQRSRGSPQRQQIGAVPNDIGS